MYAIFPGLLAGFLTLVFIWPNSKLWAIFGGLANTAITAMLVYTSMPTLNIWFGDIWRMIIVSAFIAAVGAIATFLVVQTRYEETMRYSYRRSEGEKEPIKPSRLPLVTLPILGLVVLVPILMGFFGSWSFFHASEYRAVLGTPEIRVLAEDIAPIDISKARAVPYSSAMVQVQKLLGTVPGLGSQVKVGELISQKVNGCFMARYYDLNQQGHGQLTGDLCFESELVYGAVLEHSEFSRWNANGTTPGYVLASASNLNKAYLVTGVVAQAKGQSPSGNTRMGASAPVDASGIHDLRLRYLPSAFFGDHLARHIYLNGYMAQGFTDLTFEIDDAGRPVFTASLFTKKVGFKGDDTTGVLVINPETGEMKEYSIADAPSWIDRIQPKKFVSTQINDWGEFTHGWWNSRGPLYAAGKDVLKSTEGIDLVEGADGQTYYYTGVSSHGTEQATTGFMLVNTRTKTARWYQIAGATESTAQHSAAQAPKIAEAKSYHMSFPVLYRVNGEATYFSVALGTDYRPKKYAFINLTNADIVGVGEDIHEALLDYQRALNRRGISGLNEVTTDKVITSKVKLVTTELANGNTAYYFLLEGADGKQFMAPYDLSLELKFTKAGDRVTVTAKEGVSKTLPITAFDNLDINLQ